MIAIVDKPPISLCEDVNYSLELLLAYFGCLVGFALLESLADAKNNLQ